MLGDTFDPCAFDACKGTPNIVGVVAYPYLCLLHLGIAKGITSRPIVEVMDFDSEIWLHLRSALRGAWKSKADKIVIIFNQAVGAQARER